MEKSNSDNPMWIKRNTQKNICSWQKRLKTLYAKRKKYGFKYEHALLVKQRNRHTNCSQGGDSNADYRQAHVEWSGDDPAALLPTAWCQVQQPSLFSVSHQSRREVKEDAIHHMAWSEDNGRAGSSYSKVQMKSGLLLALGWTLMIAGWAWWPGGHFSWLTGGGAYTGGHGWGGHGSTHFGGGQGSWHFGGHTIADGWQGFHLWLYWYNVDEDADGGWGCRW